MNDEDMNDEDENGGGMGNGDVDGGGAGRDSDIAIIGVGARFPDAWEPAQFWRNLTEGVVSQREFTQEELREAWVEDEESARPDYVRVGVRLPGLEEFAAEFFGIPPAEAETIDPYQRIFLEVCWEALESSGHTPSPQGPVTGVFAGTSFSTYAMALYLDRFREQGFAGAFDADVRRGSLFDFMPARAAHRLGLRGPAVAVQTACASSLTAVHQAVNALLAGDCDLALAGGTGGSVPESGYRYDPGGIHSEDGYCRSFDAKSSGTAGGAGVAVVALRRLQDALDDGDHIWAVIEGSAVNNDGADRPGFTAPSPRGVTDVVLTALDRAEVSAEQVCYVEAHGSGTALGDHVELLGLAEAFRARTDRTGYCGLGSVKANIGHAGSAAGIAGLLKAIHVAHTGTLPPHPLFTSPRDAGLLAGSAFRIDTDARHCAADDRRVLVHSMGQGGTNTALVLAPAPQRPRPSDPSGGGTVRLVLSARTRKELDAASRRLADHLEEHGGQRLADVVHTLRVGRRHFEHRRVVEATAEQLPAALRLPRPPLARTALARPTTPLVVASPQDRDALAVQALLLRAFGPGALGAAEEPSAVAPGTLVVVVGAGAQSAGIGVPATEDGADQALTAAWLAGAEVDWEAVPAPGARRVPLPTYAFDRRRHWALDRLSHVLRARPADDPRAAAPAPQGTPRSAQPGARPERLPAPQPPGDALEAELAGIWETLFGFAPVGVDDEFEALGGTSLLATRMALEIAQRHDVRLNLHRVGGVRATVRRIAEAVRARRAGEADAAEQALDGDGALIDADLELPLGPVAPARPGTGVLLTGATGFLGAFLLRELCATEETPVHCLVRAGSTEEAWQRLRETAAAYRLPEPAPDRVRVVLGDLGDDEALEHGLRAAAGVARIVHCGARVVFTEPYRSLRESNVVATARLLRWARAHGVPDFTYVSSLAACGPVGSPGRRVAEERRQPLEAESGGYGSSKWVSERLVERAELDGLRVRVFRPGLILGDSVTGACNPKDMTWRLIAGSLATGLHPVDDRPLYMAPVDVVARAIVAMAQSPAGLGRAYHLVDEQPQSLRGLFAALAGAGLATEGVPGPQWQRAVAEQALRTGHESLSAVALFRFDEPWEPLRIEAPGWQPWLADQGLSATVTGRHLALSARFLAEQPSYRGLLAPEPLGGQR